MQRARCSAEPGPTLRAPAGPDQQRTATRCAASGAREYANRIEPLALKPHIDLALDKTPFFGRAQHRDQFLEQRGIAGSIFEPGQEIEGLAEIAAVIELAGNRGQIFQAGGDMLRLVLENPAPLFLGQVPPGGDLLDRDQRRTRRLGPAEAGLHGGQLFLLGALGIAHMAGDAGEPPGGLRGQDRQRDRGGIATIDSAGAGTAPAPLTGASDSTRQAPLCPPLKVVNMAISKRGTGRGFKHSSSFRGIAKREPGIHFIDAPSRHMRFRARAFAAPRNDGGCE